MVENMSLDMLREVFGSEVRQTSLSVASTVVSLDAVHDVSSVSTR
jgi:hypothetical protein